MTTANGKRSERPYGTGALDRGLALLLAIGANGGARPLAALADDLGIPASSARRVAALLLQRELIVKLSPGRFAAGPALLALPSTCRTIAGIAYAPMQRLARLTGATAHLGLFEDDMVTYIAKVQIGAPAVLTREGAQLEAYSSAIGRVLLSLQPERVIRSYLANGPFIALTERTETDPEHIHDLLTAAARDGYAVEQGETLDGLYCTAVPVPIAEGMELAPGVRRLALSVSRLRAQPLPYDLIEADRRRLDVCAGAIAKRLERTTF